MKQKTDVKKAVSEHEMIKHKHRRFMKRLKFLEELENLFVTYADCLHADEMYIYDKLRFEREMKLK